MAHPVPGWHAATSPVYRSGSISTASTVSAPVAGNVGTAPVWAEVIIPNTTDKTYVLVTSTGLTIQSYMIP